MKLSIPIVLVGVAVGSPIETWKLGVTPEAMAARTQFARVAQLSQPEGGADIPESFDSETNWPECAKVIGDIRDQSNCGCCWAFAAAEAASDRLCIASKGAFAVPLSAQDVCFCASEDGCGGGDITSPWEFIKKGAVTGGEYKGTGSLGEGFCSDYSLPHCHHHGPQGSDPYPAEGAPGCPAASSPQCPTSCAASAKAPHNDFESDKIGFQGEVLQVSGADNIARAIMEGGPVETAFSVYSDFANYTDGIYHHTEGSQLGGHAVRIVGWGVEDGEKYWKVANSWNPHWGEKGYFRIRRGINDCGIEDMVTASSATAKWGKPANPTVPEKSLAPLKALLGVTPEAMAVRAKFAQTVSISQPHGGVEIPESFDSATNWPACAKVINEIRDQSNCGCCWAFAAAEAASDRLCIATKAAFAVPLSAEDVCFCASEDGCGGGDITSPWEFIKKGAVTGGEYKGTGSLGEGFCSDFSLPHCHHHGPQGSDPYPAEGAPGCPSASSPQCPAACDASAKAPHKDFQSDKIGFEGEVLQVGGADNIARAIMQGGPVETAFTVYSDFANYTEGIYHHTQGSQLGGHAVRIVGFGVEKGQKYWKVANSWNPHWGENGYFRIRRGNNDCGIEDMVTASSASAKWGKQVGQMSLVV